MPWSSSSGLSSVLRRLSFCCKLGGGDGEGIGANFFGGLVGGGALSQPDAAEFARVDEGQAQARIG